MLPTGIERMMPIAQALDLRCFKSSFMEKSSVVTLMAMSLSGASSPVVSPLLGPNDIALRGRRGAVRP